MTVANVKHNVIIFVVTEVTFEYALISVCDNNNMVH